MLKKINLNFKNLSDFKYDEKVIKKITNILINMPDISDKSCLNKIFSKEISIDFVFCNDEFIHEINKKYRGFDNPTDIISFALFCDDTNHIVLDEINLGEIIISVDTAKKQAKENNHSLETEIYYLITHGILHLLGFDHKTQEEYNFMVDIQNKVMKEF